jgi:mannose-6-phosphate isomerase-like protein (cupin superfamily)
MQVRRVVTGHNSNGKSVFIADGPAPRARVGVHHPGFAEALLWSTAQTPVVPADGKDPTPAVTSFMAEPGGTRFLMVTFPPDAVMASPGFDGAKAFEEHLKGTPGIAERMEPDNPGMHTTDTVDYVIVLDGEVWLELDDGKEVLLKKHDVVIQNGTRHAWRNRSDRGVTLAAVLVGAQRR